MAPPPAPPPKAAVLGALTNLGALDLNYAAKNVDAYWDYIDVNAAATKADLERRLRECQRWRIQHESEPPKVETRERIVYKDRVVPKERLVYKDRVVPKERRVYKDRVVYKDRPVYRVRQWVVFRDKVQYVRQYVTRTVTRVVTVCIAQPVYYVAQPVWNWGACQMRRCWR